MTSATVVDDGGAPSDLDKDRAPIGLDSGATPEATIRVLSMGRVGLAHLVGGALTMGANAHVDSPF